MRKLISLYFLFFLVLTILFSSVFFIIRNASYAISQAPVFTIAESENFTQQNVLVNLSHTVEEKPVYVKEYIDVQPIEEKVDITFNFMGDCTLGTYCGEFTERRFNETAERVEPEYFFEGVKHILDKGAFNIANCEGVFTDDDIPEVYKDYSPAFWFKSPAKNARIFSANGINAVSIANNHIGDYGEEGENDTISALAENNVEWGNKSKPVVFKQNGIEIVLFCVAMWDDGMPYDLCSQIMEYSQITDLQIVFFHGGTENVHAPDQYKIDYAHQFVDAGADLVVGSHPHVLQPLEVYNGVNIVYSLGNFVYGGNTAPENRTIVYSHTFHFDKRKLVSESEEIHPCYIYTGDMNAFQPVLIDDEQDKQTVLDFMYGKINSPL